MRTYSFTHEQLDALYDCINYLIQNEQNHYEECLQDNDEEVVNSHIYLKALDAFNALDLQNY